VYLTPISLLTVGLVSSCNPKGFCFTALARIWVLGFCIGKHFGLFHINKTFTFGSIFGLTGEEVWRPFGDSD
jgi:hypothetical protein